MPRYTEASSETMFRNVGGSSEGFMRKKSVAFPSDTGIYRQNHTIRIGACFKL